MKKLVCILMILLSLTACGTAPKVEIVESETPLFELKTTYPAGYFQGLVSQHRGGFESVGIINLDGNIAFIRSNKNDECTQDIFSYDLETDKLTHIADIEWMDARVQKIYEVKGNLYIYVKTYIPESINNNRLYLFKDGEFTLLSDEIDMAMVEHGDGVAFRESGNWTVVTCNGTDIKATTSNLFPSQVYKRENLTFLSLSDGKSRLCLTKDGKAEKAIEIKGQGAAVLEDIFWVCENEGNKKTMQAYDYNNRKLAGFDAGNLLIWGPFNGNGIVCIDEDYTVNVYIYEKENNRILKSDFADTNPVELSVYYDKDYMIYPYTEYSDSQGVMCDVYVLKK